MQQINAQIWTGGRTFESVEIPLPELRAGERLVKMSIAAVCGSDRHTVSGRRSGACPSILGHEGVGEIVAGPGMGQRVVFSVTAICGECGNCRRGLSAKCTQVTKVGHESFDSGWPLSGTYSSHILLPRGVTVATVPARISDEVAAIAGCSVATVMATLEAAGDLHGRSVLVNGLGMLGLVATAAALNRGAAEVLTFDPTPERAALAAELGAKAWDGTREVDVALEFSGVTAGVRTCVDSLAIGGIAVLAGSVAPGEDIAVNPEWLVRGWRTLTGVHNYEPRHLQEAVAFLAEVELPWEKILSGPIPLAQLAEEFSNPHEGLRTLVRI